MSHPCLYCGHPADQVDHIHPRSRGGTDEPSNLAPACQGCNASKGGRSVEHFLRKRPEVLYRVRAYQAGEAVLTGLKPGGKPRAKDHRLVTATLRVPAAVHDQLREMAFTSRRAQHDLLMEALNELFVAHGKLPVAPVGPL